MEAPCSTEELGFLQITQSYNSKDRMLYMKLFLKLISVFPNTAEPKWRKRNEEELNQENVEE
jgi:hypothetical protein